jgi:transposase
MFTRPESAIPSIPVDTAALARTILPADNTYLATGDRLDELLDGVDLSGLYPPDDAPPLPANILLMTTILQYMEGLSDSQVADQVRVRIDWKYALRLPLADTGFAEEVLTDFRQRLISQRTGLEMFHCVLVRLVELDLCYRWGELDLIPDAFLETDEF